MNQPLFEVKDLQKFFRSGKAVTKAVDGVSFNIYPGEVLGVVGESGCGKTTCGRTVVGLYEKDGGQVLYKGEDVHAMRGARRARFCREVQTIFQDPYSSLDSRNHVCDLIAEGLDIQKLVSSPAERLDRVKELMSKVGLNSEHANRYAHEFSGGQRQRIGIARALSMQPEFVVCDEPVSALDVSIQAQVINMFDELQEQMNLTYLFIAHDLLVVRHISDRIAVMYLGKMVELADADEIYHHPLHPYTKSLMSAVPLPDPKKARENSRIVLSGDIPSPLNAPSGCPFRTRCPHATEACAQSMPEFKEVSSGHFVACHNLDKVN